MVRSMRRKSRTRGEKSEGDSVSAQSFSAEALKLFHQNLPLAGEPAESLLSLSEEQLSYLIDAIRNSPRPPPQLSLDGWRRFIVQLHPEGIVPLLDYHLRSWPEKCRPPDEIMALLDRMLLRAAGRNLLVGRQVQDVVDAMDRAGISVLLLKGPALARTIYQDPALRISTDIDLLVHPEDVHASETVLEELGYRSPEKKFHMSRCDQYHEEFEPPGVGLLIELHWQLDCRFGLFPDGSLDRMFSRRIPLNQGDLSCDTLSPPDHLLYCAFHNVFQHRSMRLDWICDIALLMAELDTPDAWEALIRESIEHHVRIPLELAVTAAILWTGCGIPEPYGDLSMWPAPKRKERQLWQHSAKRRVSLFSSLYLRTQGQSGIAGKLRYILGFIVPPASRMTMFRRSDSRVDVPLAYLRRWSSILKHH